ncbi:MAG: hypothetical protein RRB13_09800 [bacterium]|nr:hypothetical protein [bacterium]
MKNKIRWGRWALVVLLLLSAATWGGYAYLGGYAPVTVTEEEMGPLELVFEVHRGEYGTIYPQVQRVQTRLEGLGLNGPRTFGLYYDNPELVAEPDLRSLGGGILPWGRTLPMDQQNRFRHGLLKRQSFLVARHPMRHPLSILIGLRRVYPVLEKARQPIDLAPAGVMEIYDHAQEEILYLLPLDPQGFSNIAPELER